jgi:hypothetical protein
MTDLAVKRGWSERRRSVYSDIDEANEFHNWLGACLDELPADVRHKAVLVCMPLDDGGFMIGIRHQSVG